MSLTARPWRGLEAFDELAADWEACARASAIDPLCNAHAWTRAHARAFAADADVFGWRFERGAEVVGLIALRREPARGALALRRALFLADGTFDSDYLEPPVRPGHEHAVARLLIDAARTVRGLEALVFAGLPEHSRFLHALRAVLEERALPRREHDVACLAAALPDSFEAYVAALRPRMRSKLRAALRGARERGARFAWCREAGELEAHLLELFELHERRWRAEGRAGSFADPRRRAFYHAFAAEALAAGRLRLARLEEDGRTLAAQIGVLAGSRYYQIQEGFDPTHEERRVGIALRALAIEALIAEGVRAYDFMAGDSAHKRDWLGELRACKTIAFPLPRWRARAAYTLRAWLERRNTAPEPGVETSPAPGT